MKKAVLPFLCLALVFSVLSLPERAFSQTQKAHGKALKKVESSEMVVTATRVETPVEKLPVSVQVITSKEIAESGASNLDDLLIRYLPYHFHKYPGISTQVKIRGFSTNLMGEAGRRNEVLILIDGNPAGTSNIAAIPLENIERIEIVKGPGSVVYGASAMGGTINIITKKGIGRPTASAGYTHGSWNLSKTHFSSQGGILSGKLGFSIGGRVINRLDYEPGESDSDYENTQYKDEGFSGTFTFKPTLKSMFTVTSQYFHAWDVGTPGAEWQLTPKYSKDELRRYISVSYDWGDKTLVHLSYYYTWDVKRWYFYDYDPYNNRYNKSSSRYRGKIQGIRSHVSVPTWNFGRLTAGFDWEDGDVAFDKYTPSSEYYNLGWFLEEEATFGKLSLLGGLRYDYFHIKPTSTGGLTVESDTEDYDHVSFRIGATYQITDFLRARASYGTGFGSPNAEEIAGSYTSSFSYAWNGIPMKFISRRFGNSSIDPEKAHTYEVGLDLSTRRIKAGIDLFHTDYDDKITSVTLSNTCSFSGGTLVCTEVSRYKNTDGATYEGIEGYILLTLEKNLFGKKWFLTPHANFTYYTKRELEDDEYEESIGSSTAPYISKMNITGGITLGMEKLFNLDFSGYYVGHQKIQYWRNWLSPLYGRAITKGGFAVFSSRLDVNPWKYLKLYVQCDNLFDKKYSFVDGYPMPGRAFKLGLELKI